jgi:hypothetical protein
MIKAGGSRSYVNKHMVRVRHVFRWGAENELVPASVYESLRAVPGRKRGRTGAWETEPVKPVPEADIEAVRRRVGRQIRALIDLQISTGARAGEGTVHARVAKIAV